MKFILAILVFLHLFTHVQKAPPPVKILPTVTPYVSNWYYPLINTRGRSSLKTFGQYFDAGSYIGKDAVFPNHYLGYHAGTDFELLPGEIDSRVPVYAVSGGEIVFIGQVQGYGGLILEKLFQAPYTALYGHLDLSQVKLLNHARVPPGRLLAYLGRAFSSQTGGERQHLHLGLYTKNGLYFRGYEPSLSALNSYWIDPLAFLKSRQAIEP